MLIFQLVLAVSVAQAAGSDDFFEARVRPALAKNCYACCLA